MALNKCFKFNCDFDVKYICKCSDIETYSCNIHFERHLKLANRTHHFESILSQPGEEIKDNLEKEKLIKVKAKKNALISKSKDQSKNRLKRRKIESDSAEEVSNPLKEATQAYYDLIEEESWVLNLQIDTGKKDSSASKLINETLESKVLDKKVGKKTLLDFQLSPDNTKKWDIKSIQKQLNTIPLNSLSPQDLNDKIYMLWNEGNNPEAEQDFRRICSFYKSGNSISDPALKKAYQDYIYAYHKITSIHHFVIAYNTRLSIINTENQAIDVKILDPPEPLNNKTCIALLPNGDLFCYGNELITGIALIIDRNFNIRRLPNGVGCRYSSAIYFNRNIYCFGGDNRIEKLTLSARFDLDKNQWFQLSNLPNPDFDCQNEIFNGNIIICGSLNWKILVYSVNIDSFSRIPYIFSQKSKILMKTDRLYLIEFERNYIHESDVEDVYRWKIIGSSKCGLINFKPFCTYNKGAIHLVGSYQRYWKFDLNKKIITKNGYW